MGLLGILGILDMLGKLGILGVLGLLGILGILDQSVCHSVSHKSWNWNIGPSGTSDIIVILGILDYVD
jgi:hypothetical protein